MGAGSFTVLGMGGSYSLHLSRPENRERRRLTFCWLSPFFSDLVWDLNPWDSDTHIHREYSPLSQSFLEIPSQTYSKGCLTCVLGVSFFSFICMCLATCL